MSSAACAFVFFAADAPVFLLSLPLFFLLLVAVCSLMASPSDSEDDSPEEDESPSEAEEDSLPGTNKSKCLKPLVRSEIPSP